MEQLTQLVEVDRWPGRARPRTRAKSGAKWAMGSSRLMRPSSTSVRAATVVTGLVIEAIRKIVGRSMANPVVRSRRPRLVADYGEFVQWERRKANGEFGVMRTVVSAMPSGLEHG